VRELQWQHGHARIELAMVRIHRAIDWHGCIAAVDDAGLQLRHERRRRPNAQVDVATARTAAGLRRKT
jgi:hypothetical protein